MPPEVYSLKACIRDAAQTGQCYVGTRGLGFNVETLHEGLSCGVSVVTLHCGAMSAKILPLRGMSIWQATSHGIRFGWNSPIPGPVHPQWVDLGEPSGLGWLDGFDELMVRCGLCSNGAPDFFPDGKLKWPLHGRIGNLPATDVNIQIDENAGEVAIEGMILESRFLFHRWALHSRIVLSKEASEIRIFDRVENQSDRPGSFQLLYHCNFGPPVLESGTHFFANTVAAKPRDDVASAGFSRWTKYGPPEATFQEQVYFLQLARDLKGESLAMIANQKRDLGASLRFSGDTLPYFTLWKNTTGLRDGYVTGLEPGTNYPNPRTVEEQAGRVVAVSPEESVSFTCTIGMLVGAEAVSQTIAEINRSG
jgi:hypothetical protein